MTFDRDVGASTIGVIGLGQVGGRVAETVLSSGLAVVGHQRRGSRRLERLGCTIVRSASEVLERSDVVFLALPSVAGLREVVEGEAGLCAGRGKDVVVVDLSTTDYFEKVRARDALSRVGVHMLDCPVSGVPDADSGTTVLDSMLASGEPAIFE